MGGDRRMDMIGQSSGCWFVLAAAGAVQGVSQPQWLRPRRLQISTRIGNQQILIYTPREELECRVSRTDCRRHERWGSRFNPSVIDDAVEV